MLEKENLDNISYLYYENKGVRYLIWKANGYVFTCDGTLSKEILMAVAKSIQEKL